MKRLSKILFQTQDNNIFFWCPGCNESHNVRIEGEHKWEYNQNVDKPTFYPSVLVSCSGGIPTARCHSFVKDGQIQFLTDCTHELAGQTVDLPELPERVRYYEED
jgi:hypothetical protein